MSLAFAATLALLGGLGGFASGLLGFGGGVVMFPLLFYVHPFWNLRAWMLKRWLGWLSLRYFFQP